MKRMRVLIVPVLLGAALMVGATTAPSGNPFAGVTKAVCVIQATTGNSVKGDVSFTQSGSKLRIHGHFEGLTPNQKHAIHVHQYGDINCTDGKCTGGHYNPEGHPHALPPASARHAGDLGNVQADANGKAHFSLEVENISVAGSKNPIIGRAIIIHAKPDDGGQPTGNAGGRIGYGVIGIAPSGR